MLRIAAAGLRPCDSHSPAWTAFFLGSRAPAGIHLALGDTEPRGLGLMSLAGMHFQQWGLSVVLSNLSVKPDTRYTGRMDSHDARVIAAVDSPPATRDMANHARTRTHTRKTVAQLITGRAHGGELFDRREAVHIAGRAFFSQLTWRGHRRTGVAGQQELPFF